MAVATKRVQDALVVAASKRVKNPRPVSFMPMDRVRREMLELPHPHLQWLHDSVGYPKNGVVQFVGDTNCGKSTRVFTDVGHLMDITDAPALYLACEGEEKAMAPDRIFRCLHWNPKRAKELLSRMQKEALQSVVQLMPKLRSWAKTWREKEGLDPNKSLLAIIDPYSRLMSESESKGNVVWDDFMQQEAYEMGSGSNMNHAKFQHQLARVLQAFCDLFNVLLFVVHHRTSKMDFNQHAAAAFTNMSEWKRNLMAFNKLGGSGLDGLASVTTVMTSTELVVDPVTKEATGKKVRARLFKSSHGVSDRISFWELRMIHNSDVPGSFMERPLIYDSAFAEMLAESGYLGMRKHTDNTMSCESVGIEKQVPSVAGSLFRRWLAEDPARMKQWGWSAKIPGFYSLMEDQVEPKEGGDDGA